MARSPLTWRSVTAASAGNPGSTLASGIGAFSAAARGAQDQITSLREGEAIQRTNTTEAAIADILASGKPLDGSTLGNLPSNVNTSDLISAVTAKRKADSYLETQAQQRQIGKQELDALTYANSPEERERAKKNAQLDIELRQDTLRLRNLQEKRLAAADEREQKLIDGQLAIEQNYWSEDPQTGLRGRALAYVNANREAAIRAIEAPLREQGLSNQEIWKKTAAWEAAGGWEDLVQKQMAKFLPDWMAEQGAKYGLTRELMGETTPGHRQQAIETANINAVTQRLQAEIKIAANKRKTAKKALDDEDWSSVLPAGNDWEMGKGRENRLTKGALSEHLEQNMNMDLDSGDLKKAEKILETVKGNKQVFENIMNDAIRRDRGVMDLIGLDDDEVDWVKANTAATVQAAKIEGFLQKNSEEEQASSNIAGMTIDELIQRNLGKSKKRPKAKPPQASSASTNEVTLPDLSLPISP